MSKLYIKSIIFLIITVILVKVIDRYCIQDEFFHTTYNNFLNEDNDYDFVYMGNSLSQRTYNTRYVDSILHTKSVNIGSSAQHFAITKAIFDHFIENEKLHPKQVLVIEISPWQFKKYETERLKFLQMAALDELKFSKEYLSLIGKFYEPTEYPRAMSPTIRFHDNLSKELIETRNRTDYLSKANIDGFELNESHILKEELKNKKKDYKQVASEYSTLVDNASEIKLDAESEDLILGIIEKCKEKNIKLLFVTAPALNMIYEKNEYGKMKYIETFLKSHNATHFNFNRIFNQINLTANDFSDLSHLNKYGNRKLAPILLDSITTSFDIKRGVKNDVSEKNTSEKEVQPETTKNITSDNIKGWSRVNTLIKNTDLIYNSKDSISHISRHEDSKNAYVRVKGIGSKEDADYGVSFTVKKGDLGSYFGLRISGVYPNRVDAIFDLEKGVVKGVAAAGDFKNENASIKSLGDGWYICSLSGNANTTNLHVIFGPTDKDRQVPTWEGGTKSTNDVYLVPNSIEFMKPSFENE
ncbi:hypothetical protein [uncultured Psychroserpens sp.]|uniref:phage head spike fiber domain-containing protein n=1 Tax=uncultured Psychroserpens sp. TaxID=255436 RepID=UPI0026109F68|nr:hypothetical protein [uncultured Psychroserpens sp.]